MSPPAHVQIAPVSLCQVVVEAGRDRRQEVTPPTPRREDLLQPLARNGQRIFFGVR
ncbi:MAG TPA: hypothetical protein VLK56_07195 [Solirubrobacterales bacterium]|nr:hypothetical protein [Solirubrobacterales bacterium]